MTNEEALKIAKSTNPLLIGSVNGEEKIQYVERIIYALENIDRITAERDAAIADLRKLSVRPSYIQCDCCLHFQKADGIKRCLKKPDFSGKCWEWRGMKRMTNGDRIRSMTDEELAETIVSGDCFNCVVKSETGDDCDQCAINWLKSEVEK